MTIVLAHDAIHVNVPTLPPGLACGYTTGSPDIKWTPADWAAHPGAVRICQDSTASDSTADVLDVERYAATNAECPGWAKRAQASFASAARHGQRRPAIYTSESNIDGVVNFLMGGGVRSGVSLWVADWSIGEAGAIHDITTTAGPFHVVAVQYSSGATFDTDVFSSAWLADMSGTPPPPKTPPTIRLGDKGGWVSAAQHDLNAKGSSPHLIIDGIFGSQTDASTRNFQKAHHLLVDGIIGPDTWKALGA